MIPLPAVPWRLVGAVLALLAGVAVIVLGARGLYSEGFAAGQAHEREAVREAMDARQREDQRLASQLAATARAEAQRWRDNAHQLQAEIRHARRPLVAAAAACGPVAVDRAADGHAAAPAGPGLAPPRGAGAGHAADEPQLPGGFELWLSADAVRLWNSALEGRPVPAGACGADGTPDAACAAAVHATVDDAWANHAENAARCGANAERHARLIEFLQRRQQPAQP